MISLHCCIEMPSGFSHSTCKPASNAATAAAWCWSLGLAPLAPRAVATRGVASKAQANIAAIAYHFGGKEGLYEAALARMYEQLLELELPESLPEDLDSRIRRVVGSIYLFCREHREAVRLLLRHVLDHGSLPRSVYDRWMGRLVERAAEIQEAIGLPEARAPQLALLSLNHLVARYTVSERRDLVPFTGTEDPDAAVAEHLGDVAVALLAGTPEPLRQGR